MRDPFKIDQPTCISFSGGRTGAYMLWRVLQADSGLPAEAVVCFTKSASTSTSPIRWRAAAQPKDPADAQIPAPARLDGVGPTHRHPR
jgi:hypothetical protein